MNYEWLPNESSAHATCIRVADMVDPALNRGIELGNSDLHLNTPFHSDQKNTFSSYPTILIDRLKSMSM